MTTACEPPQNNCSYLPPQQTDFTLYGACSASPLGIASESYAVHGAAYSHECCRYLEGFNSLNFSTAAQRVAVNGESFIFFNCSNLRYTAPMALAIFLDCTKTWVGQTKVDSSPSYGCGYGAFIHVYMTCPSSHRIQTNNQPESAGYAIGVHDLSCIANAMHRNRLPSVLCVSGPFLTSFHVPFSVCIHD